MNIVSETAPTNIRNSSQSSVTEQSTSKVYNDTLKANVVIDLVTLAPAKSNSGIGRPLRPRPKLDKDKQKQEPEKPLIQNVTNSNAVDETILLEKLFGIEESDNSSSSLKKVNEAPLNDLSKNLNSSVGSIEQIVEVVTSISTKVSAIENSEPLIIKISTPNSSLSENILNLTNTKNVSASILNEEEANLDRKVTPINKNELLMENLRKFAEIRTENDTNVKKVTNILTSVQPNPTEWPKFDVINLEALKKIANIAKENRTITGNFSKSFDGVPVLKKKLNKVDERIDKMILTFKENIVNETGEEKNF